MESKSKKRLLKEGLLQYECYKCGLKEWMGEPISLQLEHKNGDNTNNTLKNLTLLCPNCHSQTKTFAGKNIKKEKKKYFCKNCSVKITRHSKSNLCRKCSNKDRAYQNRKVKNRPCKITLLKNVKELGYTATGRKYGVSNTSIKKWLQN